MTATMTGASSAKPNDIWSGLNWPALEGIVLQLQMRIAKAEREGRRGKVRDIVA
jgi:RNA-directed DNA polymerase